ncbi:MAG: B12-binding domain-containing radical SAM protein [Coriobacteriia bacterium]|nr:B12-binding domain-containing radical SAM protein [Coriobacteriia bacterium]
MKVLLVMPNYVLRDEFGDVSDPPLGIASVAAVLLGAKHDVRIVDANAENLSEDQVIERLVAFAPDAVGLSCNYSPLHNPTISLAARIKSETGAFVFVGGNHASAMAEYMMSRAPAIDAIVRGEGEETSLELVNALAQDASLDGIPGLVLRDWNGAPYRTPGRRQAVDLDGLPLPAYHLLPMGKYARYNIMSSRGCPFSCSYCASNVVFCGRVRYRDPARVVDEIEHLLTVYGRRHVWFSDDTFTSNRRFTERLLDEIERRGLEFTWSCLTRVSVVDERLLVRMRSLGCTYISYGIESGNQGMLDAVGKRITVEEIVRALRITARAGLRQYGFFIVGFPGETKDTICDTYKLIASTELDGAAFNVLIPLPGTALMERLLEEGVLTYDEIEWDRLFARTPEEEHAWYSARLAERWTDLSARELIEACIVGHALPDLLKCIQSVAGRGDALRTSEES